MRTGGFLKMDGGAKEARTPDLLNAIQTLYQLSYDPIQKNGRQIYTFHFPSQTILPRGPGSRPKLIEPPRRSF